MASPDQSSYTSLVLYDQSAYTLLSKAIADAATKLPGWNPQSGSLELTLLESFCLLLDELIFTANRLPDGVMEVLMATFGIVRDLGIAPQTSITIEAIDTTGYEIPAGVQFRLDDGSGNSITFTTSEAGVITTGSSSVVVQAVGSANTDRWNGTPVNTPLVLLSSIAIIDTGKTAATVSGGASPETDNEWRDRAVQLLASLSSVLVLPDHFTTKALSYPAVFRAKTRDNWNVSASAAGHVTVAVADSVGAPLGGTAKTVLQGQLDAQAMAALQVHVVDADYNNVDVNVSVVTLPNESLSGVSDAVEAAISAYLSPVSWTWGSTVRLYEVASVVDRVPGVDYVASIEIAISGDTPAASDVELSGPFPLVDAGSVNVTVAAP